VATKSRTYYKVHCCSSASNRFFIDYWWFYYRQDNCLFNSGGHDYDWEHVVVQVTGDPANVSAMDLVSITYYQHSGRYTRKKANMPIVDTTHPIVYVGKVAHGSYHNSGGIGGCCYWDDYRNLGSANRKWQTWATPSSLIQLSCDSSAPSWMTFPGDWGQAGKGPLFRGIDYCTLTTCVGSTTASCTTSGCARSDYVGSTIISIPLP